MEKHGPLHEIQILEDSIDKLFRMINDSHAKRFKYVIPNDKLFKC